MDILHELPYMSIIVSLITLVLGLFISHLFKTIPKLVSLYFRKYMNILKHSISSAYRLVKFHFLLLKFSKEIYRYNSNVNNFKSFCYRRYLCYYELHLSFNGEKKIYVFIPFIYTNDNFKMVVYSYLLKLDKKYKRSFINSEDYLQIDESKELENFIFQGKIL